MPAVTEAPILVRVVAPHFVAGVAIQDGVVVKAAPIMRYAIGWTGVRLRTYIKRKGWTASIVRVPVAVDDNHGET